MPLKISPILYWRVSGEASDVLNARRYGKSSLRTNPRRSSPVSVFDRSFSPFFFGTAHVLQRYFRSMMGA